ncbi:MAG TPA: response regulator transcription factor [Chthoniobacterales bacterium]|nr:response regulator transcription factor [Chthoniobacterales bacterium]
MKFKRDCSINPTVERRVVRHSLGDPAATLRVAMRAGVGTANADLSDLVRRRATVSEREAPITVVVADDHPVIREGLTMILKSEKDIKIVAEAADGAEVCTLYDELCPDVILLDLRLPKKDGLQVLIELMSRRISRPRVIIMTSYDDQEDVCRAVRAGAKGFLSKVAPAQEIRKAVRRVSEGATFFPPEIGLKIAESISCPELSKREKQVLENLARGKSNKEIGCALFISEGTAKYHVKSIFRKLNAIGRAEAIAIAARRGLLQVS